MDCDYDGIKLIMKASDFAAKAHRNQLRKDNQTPYINHPIAVANILTNIGNVTDPIVISAALLHDTVEDTETTFDDIQQLFGDRICSIVKEVTDDKTLPKMERKQLQIIHAGQLSKDAKLVKLADKLHNLQDLLEKTPIDWSEQRVQEYFEWASKVISGLVGVNEPIENELTNVLSKRNVKLIKI